MNPLQLLQTELDKLLYADGVHCYWQRKADSDDSEEYIVYALNGDSPLLSTDNEVQVSDCRITVRYYYRDSLLDNTDSRAKIQSRAFQIIDALRSSDFFAQDGAFDAGNIDDTGYTVTIIELTYIRRKSRGQNDNQRHGRILSEIV